MSMQSISRLIQGDCLENMRQMKSKSIDIIITDPPYGIGEAAGKNKSRGHAAVAKDYGNLSWDNDIPPPEYFSEMLRVSKNQIIFGGNYFTEFLPPSSRWIVWDKNNGDNDFADCELAWTSFPTAVRKIRYTWNGMIQENMKHKDYRVHPTQKPVEVMKWIIEKYTEEGQTVLDPFMGSGTTGVACVRTNRPFIGVEKVGEYFSAARTRIESSQLPLII